MPSVEIHGLPTTLVVGMEIHVELATRSKMWTGAPNVAHRDHFDAAPNSLLDPVVVALPGSLPVMNREALEMSIRVGLALGCRIARFSTWDRKAYHYPDLPKSYQISQYDKPIVAEGVFDLPLDDDPSGPTRPIRILRAHLEEDAGKLMHEAPGGGAIDHSIVDLNRAGTPLLEIVTEPDFETADQAVRFGQALRNLCRHLGVTEGIMQAGHMRFEPNINVLIEKDGRQYATPIVEIKNLNSFRAVRDAIEFEHERQVEQWLDDGRVMGPGVKSTRGWDETRGVTVMQREKEDAHDYRYFPDPDLVPVEVPEAWLERLGKTLVEAPHLRQRRYAAELGLSAVDAAALVAEPLTTAYFEQVLAEGVEPKRAAALLRNNLARRANAAGRGVEALGMSAGQLAACDRLAKEGVISSNGLEDLLDAVIEAGADADPAKLAEEKGLVQVNDDSALDLGWVEQAIAAQPQAADDVRNGKMAAIGRLVGAVMKASGGKANPRSVQQKLREKLA